MNLSPKNFSTFPVFMRKADGTPVAAVNYTYESKTGLYDVVSVPTMSKIAYRVNMGPLTTEPNRFHLAILAHFELA